MLPTPAKFHYIFNLRDLSRVFQGVFQCDVPVGRARCLATTSETSGRAVGARVPARLRRPLINHEDKEWGASAHLEAHRARATARRRGAQAASRRVLFVDFMRDGGEDEETGEELPPPKVYEPVRPSGRAVSLDDVRRRDRRFMGQVQRDDKLSRVPTWCSSTTRCTTSCASRASCARPRGSALLIGVGGSGQAVAHAARRVHRRRVPVPDPRSPRRTTSGEPVRGLEAALPASRA